MGIGPRIYILRKAALPEQIDSKPTGARAAIKGGAGKVSSRYFRTGTSLGVGAFRSVDKISLAFHPEDVRNPVSILYSGS